MKNITILSILLVFSFTINLTAQNKLSLELRAGTDFPTQDISLLEIEPGTYFQIAVGYPLASNLGIFAGVHLAGYENDLENTSSDNLVAETGYFLGLEYDFTLTEDKLGLYFRGSVMQNAINVFNDDGDKLLKSEGDIGYQFESGLDFSIGNNWHIRPGVRYHDLNQTLTNGTTAFEGNLKGVSFLIGLAVRI